MVTSMVLSWLQVTEIGLEGTIAEAVVAGAEMTTGEDEIRATTDVTMGATESATHRQRQSEDLNGMK